MSLKQLTGQDDQAQQPQPEAPPPDPASAATRHAALMHLLCLGENAARTAAYALCQVQERGAVARANQVVIAGQPNVGAQAKQDADMANAVFEQQVKNFIMAAQGLARIMGSR